MKNISTLADSDTVRAKIRMQVTFVKFVEVERKFFPSGVEQLKKYSTSAELCVAKLRYLKLGVKGSG